MKCNICGGEMPHGESVCKFCGNVMPENKKPEPKPEVKYESPRTQHNDIDVPVDAQVYRNYEYTKKMYCQKCGRPLDGVTNKCIVCDRREVGSSSYEAQRYINAEGNPMAKKKSKKKQHTTRNIVLSILGLIALFTLTLLFTIGPLAEYLNIGFRIDREIKPSYTSDVEETQKPKNTWEPERDETPEPTEEATRKPEKTPTPHEEGDPVELRGGEYDYNTHTHLITEAELDKLTRQEIKFIYWEIFARHGLTFEGDELIEHFENKPWYMPTVSTEDEARAQFNDIEKRNEKTIFNYQKKMGWR